MTNPVIDSSLTINEVLASFPDTIDVLNEWGFDTCCGGADTIEAAAQEAGVDLERFMQALSAWGATSMNVCDTASVAGAAVAHGGRPATAVIHDTSDARVVVFRIEPGQSVPVHTSPSTVLLSVVSGSGFASGAHGEQPVHVGDLVAYDPREPHGMRADSETLVIAAIIAPRPGSR